MKAPARTLGRATHGLLLTLFLVAAGGCGEDAQGEQDPAGDTEGTADAALVDAAVGGPSQDTLPTLETTPETTPGTDATTPGDADAITFHFVTGIGPVGQGLDELALYTEDELPNYLAIPGFQVDVKAQLTGIPTGTACQLLVDGAQVNEWVVIEGMELQFQAVTMPLSPDSGYVVRVEATVDGLVHWAEKNVLVTDEPSPTGSPPAVSCDTLEQLLLGELAFAAAGCSEDTDCAFTAAPTCDLGPHVTCHVIAHSAAADISGILTLFDSYKAPSNGCPLMDCDCQATGAGCFSGVCKPVGY